jgi:hypothetical protein
MAGAWLEQSSGVRRGPVDRRTGVPSPDMSSDPSASVGVRVFPGSVRGADALTDVVRRLCGDS